MFSQRLDLFSCDFLMNAKKFNREFSKNQNSYEIGAVIFMCFHSFVLKLIRFSSVKMEHWWHKRRRKLPTRLGARDRAHTRSWALQETAGNNVSHLQERPSWFDAVGPWRQMCSELELQWVFFMLKQIVTAKLNVKFLVGASDLCLYIWLLSEVVPKRVSLDTSKKDADVTPAFSKLSTLNFLKNQ